MGSYNRTEATYRRPAANECPPVARTTEGASIAVEANAGEQYARGRRNGKAEPRAVKPRLEKRQPRKAGNMAETVYRASTGQIWRFSGKRARVLSMLATMGQGVTPWDCMPWHMRLGASIHVMREAGLVIETVREGEYRHARYFLRTAGSLLIQGNNRGGAGRSSPEPAMSGAMLFEQRHRGNLWRLEVVTWKGRTFANWRKFYNAEGQWKPTREGFTMPLDDLGKLTATLMLHQGLEPPERLAAGE